MITDDHPNPPAAAVALTPSQVTPGTFVNDMLIQVQKPLFSDPSAVFTMGPGFLIQNLTVRSPFTATADVTVSPRAVRHGHGVKVETGSVIAAGCVHVNSNNVIGVNARPTIDFQCPRNVRSGQPFEVTFQVNDPNHDFVTIEAVLERVEPEYILSETEYVAYETPQALTFSFPGLPAGEYAVLGLADDGHLPNGGSLCDCTFQVSAVPVVVDLVKRAGRPVSQTLTGVDSALRRVTITNGEPGLAAVDLVVNGRKFKMTRLAANEERAMDISSAMLEGRDNVVEITAYGSRRARARVVISEKRRN